MKVYPTLLLLLINVLNAQTQSLVDISPKCNTDVTQVYKFKSSTQKLYGDKEVGPASIFLATIYISCLDSTVLQETGQEKVHIYDMQIKDISSFDDDKDDSFDTAPETINNKDFALPFHFVRSESGTILGVQYDKSDHENIVNVKKGLAENFQVFYNANKGLNRKKITQVMGVLNKSYQVEIDPQKRIIVTSEYSEKDIEKYSSSVKGDESIKMNSFDKDFYDEHGKLTESRASTLITFRSREKPQEDSSDESDDPEEHDKDPPISILAKSEITLVESLNRIALNEEVHFQGLSKIAANAVTKEHRAISVSQADGITVPNVARSLLKKRGLSNEIQLKMDSLLHSSTPEIYKKAKLKKRNLNNDEITTLFSKISNPSDKKSASRLIQLSQTSPYDILPTLLRKTTPKNLSRKSNSHSFGHEINILFAALASTGIDQAHERLIEIASSSNNVHQEKAKTSLVFAHQPSQTTFNLAQKLLHPENDLYILSSMLENHAPEKAREFIIPHLEKINNSTDEKIVVDRLDAIANLGSNVILVVDSLIPFTENQSSLIRTAAVKALSGAISIVKVQVLFQELYKTDVTLRAAIYPILKKAKLLDLINANEVELKKRGRQSKKDHVFDSHYTQKWEPKRKVYQLVVPKEQAISDVEQYPKHQSLLWGSKIGTNHLNLKFGVGLFGGHGNEVCDVNTKFKLFSKIAAVSQVLKRIEKFFEAEANAENGSENTSLTLKVNMRGKNVYAKKMAVTCKDETRQYESPYIPLMDVEYSIPVYVVMLTMEVNVDVSLKVKLDYNICANGGPSSIKLIPEASAIYSGEAVVVIPPSSSTRGGLSIDGDLNQQLGPEVKMTEDCNTCISLNQGNDPIHINFAVVFGKHKTNKPRHELKIVEFGIPPKPFEPVVDELSVCLPTDRIVKDAIKKTRQVINS